MFLTGPGGSGKSQVIKAICTYSKAYCVELELPFDRRTLVVTALTGVAATRIFGETIHSATGLNRTTGPSSETINEWKNSCLLFVDEISFASINDIKKLDHCLCLILEKSGKLYSGMNMVFACDYYQLQPVRGDPIFIPHFLFHGMEH